MPQADLLSFQPTLLFVPLVFVVGYFFFVTRWAPRIVLTLKARAWLTRYDRSTLLLGGLVPVNTWPELALMSLQFAALVWMVTRVALVTAPTDRLVALGWTAPAPVTYAATGSARVENFFVLWSQQRAALFFAPAATEITTFVSTVLGGFGFFAPAKQFPLLVGRLKESLTGGVIAAHVV